MKLNNVRFIADENIHNDVVDFLLERGFEVKSASDDDLSGGLDIDLLSLASETQRGIITHDSDFGTLITTKRVGNGITVRIKNAGKH